MIKPIAKNESDIKKQLDEINRMLDYLHNKRDWVSINAVRPKFPGASRNQQVFKQYGISKKLIRKNTYICYNKYVKWWRPMRECFYFDRCSCNACPLDEYYNKRVNYVWDENHCIVIANKPERLG